MTCITHVQYYYNTWKLRVRIVTIEGEMGLGFMLYSRAGELSSVVMLDSVHVPVRKINLEGTLVMYCSVSEYTCICIKRTRFFFLDLIPARTPPSPPKKMICYFNWETFKYPFVKVSHINIYSYYIFTYKIFVSGFHNTL